MTVLDNIFEHARHAPKTIVLPEGSDERVAEAAARAVSDQLCNVILIGDPPSGIAMPSKVEIINPVQHDDFDAYVEKLFELRKHKGMTLDRARTELASPLVFAAMMVQMGHADGTLGGAVHTTADTVRAALQIIGKAPDTASVSSFFLMVLPGQPEKVVLFSDCALVALPNASQLAQIAIASAGSFQALTGEDARVAMLSFSTLGSADTPEVQKVRQATALVKENAPHLVVDGELQFDAAFDAGVAAKKAADSPLKGAANIFVFPNLDAGNIGYKIAQRIGGAVAIGPILQGLAAPANDLSRGCSADDVYAMLAVTAVQASSC